MTKETMILGLKAGRTLYQDGSATDDERRAVDELVAARLVTRDLETPDQQYSRHRIRWRRVSEDELAAGEAAVCAGCGSRRTLIAIYAAAPDAMSCCPERVMLASE